MRLKILVLSVLTAALMATSAQAKPPCVSYVCHSTLHASPHVKHWAVKGNVGEQWLLYLNVYVGEKRLAYKRLPGGCEAGYAGRGVSVLLHACGHRSRLDYVAFGAPKRLNIEYRYVRR